MNDLTVTVICRLLESKGGERLQHSPVSLLEHVLQTAWLAERARSSAALVSACLLHDLGRLLADCAEADGPRANATRHDGYGAAQLASLFGAAVTDPIRLHVRAKRYLCYARPGYVFGLSDEAKRTLERQGGMFDANQARAFMQEPYAVDAVNLRLWDDAAHKPGVVTPSLAHFAATLRTCVLPKRESTLVGPGL